MQEIEENKQWLLDANCDICKRKNYCSKPCTKFKRLEEQMFRDMVKNAYIKYKNKVEDIKNEENSMEE